MGQLRAVRDGTAAVDLQRDELLQAYTELESARVRYFDLYDQAPIGYCTISHRGVIVQANLTAVTMLGVSRGTSIGRDFARFVDTQDHRVFHSLLRKVTTTTGRHSAELRMLHGAGTVFWAQLVVTTGEDEAGAPECRIVLSDVSDRMQVERGRHEVEAHYRELFSRAVDGIVVCSARGLVEDVNAAFCRLHGWSEEELIGQSLSTVDTAGVTLAPEHMGRMLMGQTSAFEVEHRHRDGSCLQLSASTSLIFVAGVPRLLGYYRPRSSGS